MEMNNTDVINSGSKRDCCIPSGTVTNFAQPQLSDVCVNIGSKSGEEVLKLAVEVGSNGFVFGIEPSSEKARKYLDLAEILDITNVDFIHSGLENIKLGNEIADLVISDCALHKAKNKKAVWHEIHRILKQGGGFVVHDIYVADHPLELASFSEEKCQFGALTRGEYLQMLYDAGFVSVRILEQSQPSSKEGAGIVSFTVRGEKPGETKAGRCRL
jgi:arsenite methyltransferase